MIRQMCWDGGGKIEGVTDREGGLLPMLMLEKWSQLENFWMHDSPLPSERTDLLNQHSSAGELCLYWQAGEAQLPPLR